MKKNLFMLAAICITYNASQLTAQSLPDYLPADGLVGWWPFNGNANDESGNGNHGTVNGVIPTQDRYGQPNSAYHFSANGALQNITTNLIGPTGSAARTISFWFFQSTNISSTKVLCGYGGQVTGSTFVPVIGYNNKLGIDINGGEAYYQSNTFGSWNHCVYEYKPEYGSGVSSIKIHLNGILLTASILSNPQTAQINTGSTLPFFIGDFDSNQQFNGDIDDVAIYNRVLTSEEIQQLFQAENPGASASPFTTVPAFINYQAVARNPNGDAMADAEVQVRFSLLADSLSGAVEYAESHSLTTNSLGLFTTAFGAGTPEVSSFDSIAWNNSTKFLRVELNTGNGYIDMGTQQLLSVPFALRAQSAATIRNESLPVFNDNASAIAAGLTPGMMYRTGSGVLMVVY